MADPLAALTDACKKADGSCPGRTHFVLHQTVDGKLTKEKIKARFGGKKNKAHQYILKSGEVVPLWRLSQKDVYATKSETNKKPLHGTKPPFPLKGKMFHIEIDYEEQGEPNDKQYNNARYWGKPNYKTPFDTDTFSWPPKLSGNPHA